MVIVDVIVVVLCVVGEIVCGVVCVVCVFGVFVCVDGDDLGKDVLMYWDDCGNDVMFLCDDDDEVIKYVLEYFYLVGYCVWGKVMSVREDERKLGMWRVVLDASVVD